MTLILSLVISLSAAAQSIPGTKRDRDFDAAMATLNLDDPSYQLEYKKPTSDGSSIGVFIGKDGAKPNASFVPTNTSSIPEAEVVSYRLARFLGVSRNYYPVAYYYLGPKAFATFRDMVLSTPEIENDRIANRKMVMRELKRGPETLLGIYRQKPKTKMYPALSLGAEGQFFTRTPLARAIRANGPMPDDEKISLDGIKGGAPGYPSPPVEQQLELARQLSTIFVIDQLLGQWDRFWSNLEASGDKAGRLKLIARDNGGATLDDMEEFDVYSPFVSRFDPDLIAKLTALNSFLKGETKDFEGLTDPDKWKEAAGFISPSSFEVFKKKLALLINTRVPELKERYGEAVFFPAKTAEIRALDAADTGEDD